MAIVPDQTFVVTSFDDSETLDSFISFDAPAGGGPSVPDEVVDRDTSDGSGLTLREAIFLANLFEELDGSASRITFDPALSGMVYRLTEGEIEISANLVIDGDINNNGTPDIILSGDADGDDRDASGLTVAQGGTGITDLSSNPATRLDDNTRIFEGTGAGFALELDGLTLTGGRTTADDQGGGAVRTLGSVELTNSMVSGNSTTGSRADGGAIFAQGALGTENTQLTGNQTQGTFSDGGAVFGASTVAVIESTFGDNSTNDTGARGGALLAGGALTSERSTFAYNSTAAFFARGGAIYGADTAVLTNTTLVGNTTSGDTSGGGGIATLQYLSLVNSTVTGNSTTGGSSAGGGGLLSNDIRLTNSLVLGNTTTYVGVDGEDIGFFSTGVPTYSGGNIVGSLFSIGPTTRMITDATDVFAQTQTVNGVVSGVLTDNGGPVQTVALKLDKANRALDASNPSAAPTTDARGFTRPVDVPGTGTQGNRTVDLGATEVQVSAFESPSLIVTTTDDVQDPFDDETSLREAIRFINNGTLSGTITFANGTGEAFETGGTITLGGSQLVVRSAVTIDGDVDGDGKADVTIDANNRDRVFLINDSSADTDAVLKSLTLTNGASDLGGGGIAVSPGASLILVNSTVRDSEAAGPIIFYGGGILAFGGTDLLIVNSTISGNSAPFLGGGIAAFGNVTVVNSTIYGNTSDIGGGIAVEGELTLQNTSVVGNTIYALSAFAGDRGAGVALVEGLATIENSVIAGNTRGGVADDFVAAPTSNRPVTTNVTNSFFGSDDAADFDTSVGVINNGGDPGLGSLADNGGPVQTLAILPGSALIDAGANSALPDESALGVDVNSDGDTTDDPITVDAAGQARVAQGLAGGGAVDIGAFEIQPEPASLVVTITDDIVDPLDNETSLREAVQFANTIGGASTITFASGSGDAFASDAVIRLTQGAIEIVSNNLTFDGASAGGQITITGDARGDDILIAGTNVTDVAATLASDAATRDGVDNDGDGDTDGEDTEPENLLDDNSRLFIDTTSGGGTFFDGLILTGGRTTESGERGGAFSGRSEITLTNSSVLGNSTAGNNADGGGISAGFVRLTNSTVAGNSTEGNNAEGGAVSALYATYLTNSTVSGNSTAGRAAFGGGIYAEDVEIANSTISGNSTLGSQADGGGVFAYSSADIVNSIVSGNVSVATINDELRIGTNRTLEGGNIIGGDLFLDNDFQASFTPSQIFAATEEVIAANGNGTGTFAGVLVDNGGPTETVLILAGGAAQDAGGQTTLTTDQRGEARPFGAANDIGAVEVGVNGVSLLDAGLVNVGVFPTIASANAAALDGYTIDVDGTAYSGSETIFVDVDGLTIELDAGLDVTATLLHDPGVSNLSGAGDGRFDFLGNDNANLLIGGSGIDTLSGGDGDDTLVGGEGMDSLWGGGDTNTADYSGSDARVEVDLVLATGIGGHAAGDTLINIQNLIGSDFNDRLIGGSEANLFEGGLSADNLNGRGGEDTLRGDAGGDLLSGGNDDDRVEGGGDNDNLFGNGGADTIFGGQGEDTIAGGIGTDSIEGGSENDTIIGQGQNDTIMGNEGEDMLRGGSGNDTVDGGGDNDNIQGQGNNDLLRGGAGDDTLNGAAGLDTLEGGGGDDLLLGGDARDRLDGGSGNDTLSGGNTDFSRDDFVFAVGYERDRINAFDQAGADKLLLDQDLWLGANPGGLTGQQVIDAFGSLNTNGTILTLDFGGGDILEVQNSAGIILATLGADVVFI